MKLSNYTPRSRQVLFHEVRRKKTAGGVIIPEADFKLQTHSEMFEHDKEHSAEGKIGEYVVLAIGKDCPDDIKPGDFIMLMEGIRPGRVVLEDGTYLSVMEQQIIGVQKN